MNPCENSYPWDALGRYLEDVYHGVTNLHPPERHGMYGLHRRANHC
jgi:hypothetical protein